MPSCDHYLNQKIRDFVETNLVEAAQRQKAQFDKHSKERSFGVGDPVWVSIPTAGKLDPRWEGNWIIKAIKSPSTFEISNANKCKVVHINRLRHRTELAIVTEWIQQSAWKFVDAGTD